jgi:nucleotide-binding universal stress UspA family protein
MAHDLIQYIDSSIFVVNQLDLEIKYRILLAVDDSAGTEKAVAMGARVANAFGIEVDILTVSKKDNFGEGYKQAAENAGKVLESAGIQYEQLFRVGEPASVIKKEAGDNHIIIMGRSSQNPLMKFIKGSKPLKVMEDCSCPVLIVK